MKHISNQNSSRNFHRNRQADFKLYEKAKELEWAKIFEIRIINFLNSDVNFKLPTGEVMTHID